MLKFLLPLYCKPISILDSSDCIDFPTTMATILVDRLKILISVYQYTVYLWLRFNIFILLKNLQEISSFKNTDNVVVRKANMKRKLGIEISSIAYGHINIVFAGVRYKLYVTFFSIYATIKFLVVIQCHPAWYEILWISPWPCVVLNKQLACIFWSSTVVPKLLAFVTQNGSQLQIYLQQLN